MSVHSFLSGNHHLWLLALRQVHEINKKASRRKRKKKNSLVNVFVHLYRLTFFRPGKEMQNVECRNHA